MTEPAIPSAPPLQSARPGRAALALAAMAIVLAGVCGALIGYAFTDLQCEGDCTVPNGVSGILGGVMAAGGTSVVVVLTLRAMGEWRTIRQRDAQRDTGQDGERLDGRGPAAPRAPRTGPPTC